jgi:uncharacterized membrane protein YbhN (UPF0104 family)
VLWTATGASGNGPVPSTLALLRRVVRSPLPRVLGTAAGILLLARCVDLRSAAATLGSAQRGWLAAGVGLAGAAFLTAILEWGVWLRAASARVTWVMVSSWQAQSVFLSSVLPTGAGGDALRAVEAVRATGIGRGLASLVGSRLAGHTGMAAWGFAGALLLAGTGLGGVAVVGAAAWAALIVVAWTGALCAAPVVRRLGEHRGRIVRRLAGFARPLTDAMSWYRGHAGVLAASVTAGIAGWGLHLLSLGALGRAVGVEVSPAIFALLVPVALLVTLVPITVNGMGVREGVLVALLMRYGVDAHRAAVLALLADLQALPIAVVGAALWFSRRG